MWLEGSPGWFAISDAAGFGVIACGDEALMRFVTKPIPRATKTVEYAVLDACHEFLETKKQAYGRLEISPAMYVHFGTTSALVEQSGA